MSRRPSVSRTVALAAIVVASVAFLAYASSLGNGFAYDDELILVENPLVTGPLDPGRIFTTPYWGSRLGGGLYRPLTVFTYALQHRVHGLAPFGYHLVNVLLHAAVAALVLLVAMEWLALPGTLAAGLLFAVHPIHSEAVANVVGRAELLAALGVLLAWRLEPRAGGGWGRRAASALAFAAGLLAKEVALAWLGVGLLLAFVRRRRPDAMSWALYVLVAAGYLALRLHVLGGLGNPPGMQTLRMDNVILSQPFLPGFWTALGVFGRYVVLLLFPWRLSADYSWPMIDRAGAGEPGAWAGLLALVTGVGVFGLAARRARVVGAGGDGARRSDAAGADGAAGPEPSSARAGARAAAVALPWGVLAVGLGAFGLTFLPVSNFVFRIGTIMAERVLYLPSVGFLLAAGALAGLVWGRARGAMRPALLAAGALVVVAGGVRCWTRGADWRDNLTIHSATVRAAPRSSRAHRNLGMEYLKAGRTDEARAEFERSVALDSTDVGALSDLGSLDMAAGNLAGARVPLERALRIEPNAYTVLVNLGALEWRDGRGAAARELLERAVRLEPARAEGWFNLGLARAAVGDTSAGLTALRESVRLRPGDSEAWVALGGIALARGAVPEAREALRTALRLEPERCDALVTLGALEFGAGRPVEAREPLERATRACAGHAEAWFNAGLVRGALGDAAGARAALREAARLAPDDADIRAELARVEAAGR